MKIATTVVSRAVSPVISANVTECQKGFVSGRNFLDNLRELDTELRILTARAGEAPGVESIPMQFSLDIKAAFLSVSRQWLSESLAATDPPAEVATFVASLYFDSEALYATKDGVISLFRQDGGVAQGCPANGWLFAVAFDAPLRMMSAEVEGRGLRLRGRRSNGMLERAGARRSGHTASQDSSRDRVVHVNPSKTALAPVVPEVDAEVAMGETRAWLRREAPMLAAREVKPEARILGFVLSPRAAGRSWDAPLFKWEPRAWRIADAMMATNASAHFYHETALAVLGYVALLDTGFRRTEEKLLALLLRPWPAYFGLLTSASTS